MKILHVCLAAFYIDNHSYQENMLPKYHKEMGHEVEIIASTLSFDEKGKACNVKADIYTNEHGIKVTRLNYSRYVSKSVGKFFRVYDGFYDSLLKIQPDLIFIHGCQFLDIKYVVKYAKIYSPEIYFDNHADFSNSATNWISKVVLHQVIWRHCAKKIEPFSNKIYGVLPARTKFLIDVYNMPKKKVEYLPMGADDDKIDWANKEDIRRNYRHKLNVTDDDFLIITGGKIDAAKTQTLLLMKAVNQLEKNVKLIVFGSIVPELEEEFSSLCDGLKIQYIGWINSDEVYNYFLTSDLGVFPGRHSVMWEQAVGTALPCIFKHWEGTTHVDVGGNCLFTYDDTIIELYELIKSVSSDEVLYSQMKNVALEKGVEYFSYKEISKKSIGNKII